MTLNEKIIKTNWISRKYFFLFAFQIFFVFGCSTEIKVQELPFTANVENELQTLNSDLNTAADDQVNVLSPNNFREAQSALQDAKENSYNQKDSKDTLHKISIGRAYLNQAQEVASLSRTNMEEVVMARQEAISAGAPEFFNTEFKKADNKLKDATVEFEKNNIKSATKNRANLQSGYLALELQAIKYENLNHAKQIIAKSIEDGAEKMAPQSLEIAKKNLKDTDAYITANRHENEQIKTRAMAVNKSAEHLLKITHDSQNTKKVSPEELALQMENKQNQVIEQTKISKTLGEENNDLKDVVTDQLIEMDAQNIVSQSLGDVNQDLNDQVSEKKSALGREQKTSQELGDKNEKLKSEKEKNDMFEVARSEFTKEEAEVYKQGNTLTIRLRGLEFPSSKAVLKGSNFSLLAKVQKVIKDFDSNSVIVEGHTDSIGGQAANTKLSTNRANAVREYFISNGSIPSENIKAVGYGYKKPLATNKTANGRAQNRRVDVLINLDTTTKL